MAENATNAGTIYVGVAANTKPLENGFRKATRQILGLNNMARSMMKGFFGANIISHATRMIYSLAMSSEEMKKFGENVWETGHKITNYLLTPLRKIVGAINDIKEANVKINIFEQPPGTYQKYFKQMTTIIKPEEQRYLDRQELYAVKIRERAEMVKKLAEMKEELEELKTFPWKDADEFLSMDIIKETTLRGMEEYKNKIKDISKEIKSLVEEGKRILNPPKENRDPFGILEFLKNYAKNRLLQLRDKLKLKEFERERVGIFRRGDEPWREAVTNRLRGGIENKLVNNSDRIAKAVESLDKKWDSKTSPGGLE